MSAARLNYLTQVLYVTAVACLHGCMAINKFLMSDELNKWWNEMFIKFDYMPLHIHEINI